MKFNTFKTGLLVLIAMIIATASAFAMAPKPADGSWNWYLNKPYDACLAYGNPWAPNWQYTVDPVKTYNADGSVNYKLDASGNKIAQPLCSTVPTTTIKDPYSGKVATVPTVACFDNTKPAYDINKWRSCAQPYYDYANTCFKWDGSKRVKIACALTDPTGFYKS